MTEKLGKPKIQTVLLIDDEAYFRRFVGMVLKKGLVGQVIEARDGREGIKAFEEHKPDMVMLDINMPHMDGIQTLTALRQISATVPIIMLTSVSEENVVEECVTQGASFFIRKDVSAHQLSAELHDFLEQHEPPA